MTTIYLSWCALFGSIPFLLRYAQGQILSRNRAVTVSSTFDNWDGSRAVDGNYNTSADDCQCCAATNKTWNPWIKVDLGDIYTVTRVLVYSRSDKYLDSQNITGLTIIIDDEREFKPPSNKWYRQDTFFNYAFNTSITARTVNFTLPGERHLVLCEVDVIYDRIISNNKTVNMDSKYNNWVGSRAVDGNLNTDAIQCDCCAATNCSESSWLHVDLGAQYVIYYVTIYGRTDGTYSGQSFEGMSITFDNQEMKIIPNVSEFKNTTSFYEFRSEITTNVNNVTLRLLHKDNPCRTQLVVCELVIHGGCQYGTYGENCSDQCGHCRGNKTCDFVNGACKECENGYKEIDMLCKDLCENGTYGHNCTETCGSCRGEESCNQKTGKCTQCEYGFLETDFLCNDLCPNGSHGFNCSLVCGQCRDNSSCNQTNGMCEQCKDGYTENNLLCTELCPNGTYGHNCSLGCGQCRDNSSCNQTNGMCEQCEDGYTENNLLCTELCPNGTHGYDCSLVCGQCRDNSSCNQTNGICEQCEDGFTENNLLCTELCPNGTYGYNCSDNCGQCKNNSICIKFDGLCGQCEDGYTETNLFCTELCPNGTYGRNCSETCGHCRDNSPCNQTNGMCEQCEDGYTETNLLCTNLLRKQVKAESKSNGGVIAGTVCGILVICGVAIVVVVFLKRRRTQNEESNFNGNENELSCHSLEPGSISHSDPDGSIDNTEEGYANMNRTPNIRLDNLWSYIYKHKGNNAEILKSEYNEIAERLLFSTDDAIKYKQKVRYRDMVPYDHTRVHLEVEDEDECEFINASHIDGFDRNGKFIAAQGPMQVNVVDFWRMVWQYNISKIVMLTNPVEMAAVKCIQYWADEGEVTYEKIRIVLLHEETREDYVIRTFDIYKLKCPSKQVRQFHYRAWPDKDVPRSAWSLVDFWREVMKDDNRSSAPIVVHCSAGVGRTGTFIALDNLYNQAKQKGSVIPVEIVTTLRHQRQKMVQTKDQYVYLHDAVAEALLVGTHHIPEAKFNQYYSYMMQTDSSTKKPRLNQQYQLLLDGLKHYEPDGQTSYAASNAENLLFSGPLSMELSSSIVKKIMEVETLSILPLNLVDEYKPKTQAKVLPKNFSSVMNYDGKEVFIHTIAPQEDTMDELWRLIDQLEMKSVVTLADRNASSGLMLPPKPNRYQPELVDEKTEMKYTIRSYTFKRHQTSKASHNKNDVKQFVLWVDKNGLPDKDSVLKVIQEIFKWQFKMSDSQPVLMQCWCLHRDTTRTGIMCVLLNEVDRMLSHNGRINILESVTLMKRKMPGFISTFEQYRYIHEVLHQLVMSKEEQDQNQTAKETDIYVNLRS